jgi:chromate transporter
MQSGGPSRPAPAPAPPSRRSSLRAVGLLFLKLGCIAFGGPAAHIALMREEVVRRRGWLSEAHFLDLLGATNLIPGPNSTEMAIHIGFARAGWRGLVLAGVAFIMPAVVIVLAIAWVYERYGTRPAAEWLLYGVKPVIIAVVGQALWALARTAVKGPLTAAAGLAVLALALAGANEIAVLFATGAVVMVIANARRRLAGGTSGLAALVPLVGGLPGAAAASGAASASLWGLFWFFLKVGSVLFGSGYVLLAFIRADLVERYGWLTEAQLLDAVAVGQFTPGPVFTTATFIGYVLAGLPGAAVATVGIFLPAFVFVAASHPLIPRLRRSPWAGAFLDGVNVASLGLMAAVAWQLGRAAIVDPPTAALALAAGGLLIYRRVNSAWLVLGGGLLGLGWRAVR